MSSRGNVRSLAAMTADPRLEGQRPLPADTITLPRLLQNAGYATGMVGKWGLGYPGSESTPNKMGFDFFYGYNCQRVAHTYYPPFMWRNDQREPLNNKLLPPEVERLDKGADPRDEASYAKFTQQQNSATLMYEEVLKFIETAAVAQTAKSAENPNGVPSYSPGLPESARATLGNNKKENTTPTGLPPSKLSLAAQSRPIQNPKPFYLYWAPTIPHVSLQAPERWVKYYVKKFGDEPPYLSTPQSGYYPCRYPNATYAAMVSYLDEQVGGLIAKLKTLGIYENTLILFTSDNGPASGCGVDPAWFESARPFKSASGWVKGHLREGGIREPMIISWPARIKPNTQSPHICAGYDILATLCDLANIPPPPNDGISFLPTLLGQPQPTHDYLYWEFPESGGQKSIRMGKWKGLILNIRAAGDAKMLLYDLEADPLEQHDLATAHPEILKTLRQKMTEAHTPPQIDRFKF